MSKKYLLPPDHMQRYWDVRQSFPVPTHRDTHRRLHADPWITREEALSIRDACIVIGFFILLIVIFLRVFC